MSKTVRVAGVGVWMDVRIGQGKCRRLELRGGEDASNGGTNREFF